MLEFVSATHITSGVNKKYSEGVTVAPEKPFGRSLSDFLDLKPGEQKLLEACRVSGLAWLGNTMPDSPTDENCVRAEFLRFLLLGGDEKAPVNEQGMMLHGAFVKGRLDLNGCHVKGQIRLKKCRFEDLIFAMDARIDGTLVMAGSCLEEGFLADRLYCSGGIFLRDDFKSKGLVSLSGAQIGGDLSLHRGQIEVDENNALMVDRATIKGDVFLNSGFKATGAVQFNGVKIEGNLICDDGHFIVREGKALMAQGAYVGGDVFFGLAKSELIHGEKSEVDSIDIYKNAFEATGDVWLIGSQINGDLDCRGGQFKAKDIALIADRSQVKGGVYFAHGFNATGQVRLVDACIDGELLCDGGQFKKTEKIALWAEGVEVKGNLSLGNAFKATGVVNLSGAKVGGDLDFRGAQFLETEDYSLYIDGAVVQGAWLLNELVSKVCVNASHAEVALLVDSADAWAPGSRLDGFRYAAFAGKASTSGKERVAWLFRQPNDHLSDAEFRPQPWRQLQRVLREMGHLEDAKQVGIAFEDHLRKIGRMGLWPNDPCDLVRGFKGMVTRTAHCIFGKLAGYGYRPINLVMWMLAVWLLCGGIYWALARSPFNAMAPSDPLVFQDARYSQCRPTQDKQSDSVEKQKILSEPTAGNWPFCSDMPGEYSTFSPLVYSLDLLLPVVDLGQEKFWGSYIPSLDETAAEESVLHWRWGFLVRLVAWFETLFGWVSSLLLVAIISGFSRRNDEE